jgi:hypothetical protein
MITEEKNKAPLFAFVKPDGLSNSKVGRTAGQSIVVEVSTASGPALTVTGTVSEDGSTVTLVVVMEPSKGGGRQSIRGDFVQP